MNPDSQRQKQKLVLGSAFFNYLDALCQKKDACKLLHYVRQEQDGNIFENGNEMSADKNWLRSACVDGKELTTPLKAGHP